MLSESFGRASCHSLGKVGWRNDSLTLPLTGVTASSPRTIIEQEYTEET